MKKITIFSAICLLACISWMAFRWCANEEWTYKKKCADCELLEEQKKQRLVGTIKLQPNEEAFFTDQLMKLDYHLKPCDVNCEHKELLALGKIGVIDYATNSDVYFEIEGTYNPEKDEFVYSAISVLNERKFVDGKEKCTLTHEEMKERYTALEEDTFLLNTSHHAGLRALLPRNFTKEQLKQTIQIKEATFETSDSTLITIWFAHKLDRKNKWLPFEQYEWVKGTEF